MKPITLPVADLKTAIIGIGKVISTRSTLPVLGHALVKRTKDGTVAITGTDLDSFATFRLASSEKQEPVSMLVPFSELSSAVKASDRKDQLLIEPSPKQTVLLKRPVGGQMIEQPVTTLPVEEFPGIPQLDGKTGPIGVKIRNAILQAWQCASTDETRLVLNSAYLDVSVPKCHHAVGTDGRALFSSNSFSLDLQNPLILPTHRFLEWKEFAADGEWALRVGPPKKDEAPQFEIRSEHWSFIARSHEGQYPNWRQVVPTPASFQTEIQVDPEAVDELIELVQRLPHHDPIHFGLMIEVSKRHVTLMAKSSAQSAWNRFEVTGATPQGTDVRIIVNRNLLIKALRFGLTRIEIIDSLSPLKFSEGGRQMIVMPLKPDAVPGSTFKPATAASPTNQCEPPPTAEQPEKTTMPRTASTNGQTNGNGHRHATAAKPALETALDQIEAIKGSYREAIHGLNELTDSLKQVQREHKTVQSVRTTLEKLQTVRI